MSKGKLSDVPNSNRKADEAGAAFSSPGSFYQVREMQPRRSPASEATA
jgi:hypothetical protein